MTQTYRDIFLYRDVMQGVYSILIFLLFYAVVIYWARKAAKDMKRDARNVYPMARKQNKVL